MRSEANILNLSGFSVLRIEETEHDYHVYAESVASTTACPHCRSQAIVGFGRHERLIRDLPVHGKRVGIYVNARRHRCQGCTKTFFERLAHVDDRRDMTKRLLEWIGKQSIKRPFAHIADETGVVEGTVRAVFRDYITELQAKVRFETPEWMGVDEIHILKRPRAVFGNIKANTIVELLPDRNKKTVMAYLSKLPHRERVRFVAMDMWRPYRDACEIALPQAQVVVDKFHVLRMANSAMEAIRKSHRAGLEPKLRRALMHDRFVLLKRPRDLGDQEKLLLSGWTANYPALGLAYKVKEAFYGLYDCETKADAIRYYQAWENSLPADLAPAFKDITTAFKNWQPLILAYFDHRITNAFSESMNNLIRLMNRLGRGYSFEALRAKVLFTDKLHKVQRPRFQRMERDSFQMRDFTLMTKAYGLAEHPQGVNLGVDISTLAAMLEAGTL